MRHATRTRLRAHCFRDYSNRLYDVSALDAFAWRFYCDASEKSETILFDRHEQSEQYDVIREVSSVSFPLLFDELFKIVRIISDDEIESSGIVVSHFFKLLTFIVSDTFDVVAQYGKLSPAFQQSEIFRDFDLKTKI
jgi:hypothetical protein